MVTVTNTEPIVETKKSGGLVFGENIKIDKRVEKFDEFDKKSEDKAIKFEEKKPSSVISSKSKGLEDDDVQARYEALVKSGATAISSDMLFGEEERL